VYEIVQVVNKTVRPSVELEDRVIRLNCIYDLIEQIKVIKINERKMSGMSFARWPWKANNLVLTIESTRMIVIE
jgi:hypothetical protein